MTCLWIYLWECFVLIGRVFSYLVLNCFLIIFDAVNWEKVVRFKPKSVRGSGRLGGRFKTNQTEFSVNFMCKKFIIIRFNNSNNVIIKHFRNGNN